MPKLVLLLDDDAIGEAQAPSWFSTAAMRYKDGRKKVAAFFAVKAGKDAAHAATRFGLSHIPAGGALFACVPDGSGGGHMKRFDGSLASGGGGERTRTIRAFVDYVLAGLTEDEREPLPAFPEPTRPRKAAAVSLEEFTHDSLPLRCYGVQAKPLCVFAILPGAVGAACPEAFSGLARRHANDPVSFGYVGGAKQRDFLSAYGLDEAALPALVAVKAGRRPRYAKLNSPLEAQRMTSFVDNILGGGASFTRAPASLDPSTAGLPRLACCLALRGPG